MAESVTDYDNQNLYVNSNYRFADTLGHVWNMDLDYGIYNAKRLNDQPNYYFNGNESVRLFERVFHAKNATLWSRSKGSSHWQCSDT